MTVFSVITNNTQESERETLRQAVIRSLENVHMTAHSLFMKRTINSQKSQEERLDAIMSHMSFQFETLRADMGHMRRQVQHPYGFSSILEGEAIKNPREEGGHLITAEDRLSKPRVFFTEQ